MSLDDNEMFIHDSCIINEVLSSPPTEDVTISTLFVSLIQSVTNNMPKLPSDHINEIVEVDFPTELAVSTFYQLLSQMTLLGSTIFHKCTIVRLLSFTDWNRKYSFADDKPIWISSFDEEKEFDELLKEQFINDDDEQNTYEKSLEQQTNSGTLEIVVQQQYLSPQSELFSKIFHYLSTTICVRPIPCGRHVTRIIIPIPSISTIEPILTWLYNHDDEAWMDTITSKNFDQVCRNAIFLGLNEEAFAVLERVFQRLIANDKHFM
ncbi:2703_t:CDS:2 [Funneliformis geosporum]|uniref:2703_t:CDS:1 n=1 Tax=Funneliformis geosporum TaxID=1117311 RepID=A0A9W4WZG0_9GLOM|nr:2703_t:CDS:2 [Funneliformis geosporum]